MIIEKPDTTNKNLEWVTHQGMQQSKFINNITHSGFESVY